MPGRNPIADGHDHQADLLLERVAEIAGELGLPFVLAVPGTESCPTFVRLTGAGCDGHALADGLGQAVGRIAGPSSPRDRSRLVGSLQTSFWTGVAGSLAEASDDRAERQRGMDQNGDEGASGSAETPLKEEEWT